MYCYMAIEVIKCKWSVISALNVTCLFQWMLLFFNLMFQPLHHSSYFRTQFHWTVGMQRIILELGVLVCYKIDSSNMSAYPSVLDVCVGVFSDFLHHFLTLCFYYAINVHFLKKNSGTPNELPRGTVYNKWQPTDWLIDSCVNFSRY